MASQHDALWAASVAYERAKADPATTPAELEALESAWRILTAHWPYSRDLETAQEADKQTGKLNVSVPHDKF